MKPSWFVGLFLLILAVPGAAQTRSKAPAILGTWKFDLTQGKKSGPRTVIVRADSSASRRLSGFKRHRTVSSP